jgi:hypothetical protein
MSAHTPTRLVQRSSSHPYCSTCCCEVVATRRGQCPWCCEQLDTWLAPSAIVHPDLQRAFEATTLLHLTEPRPER